MYPQSMFWSKIRKICISEFCYIEVGYKGVCVTRKCYLVNELNDLSCLDASITTSVQTKMSDNLCYIF